MPVLMILSHYLRANALARHWWCSCFNVQLIKPILPRFELLFYNLYNLVWWIFGAALKDLKHQVVCGSRTTRENKLIVNREEFPFLNNPQKYITCTPGAVITDQPFNVDSSSKLTHVGLLLMYTLGPSCIVGDSIEQRCNSCNEEETA